MGFQKIPPHAEKVYQGVLHSVYHWQQELFDGSFATFEAVKRSPSVTTIALTTEGKVLIIEETQPYNGSYTTLPGGAAESDDLLKEAQRELLEETGYKSDDWQKWTTIDVVLYSKLEWESHFYIAKGCYKVSDQTLDAGESITVKEVTLEAFAEIVKTEAFGIDYIKSVMADDTKRAALMSLL